MFLTVGRTEQVGHGSPPLLRNVPLLVSQAVWLEVQGKCCSWRWLSPRIFFDFDTDPFPLETPGQPRWCLRPGSFAGRAGGSSGFVSRVS